jgi:hypothetical protein
MPFLHPNFYGCFGGNMTTIIAETKMEIKENIVLIATRR